MWRNSHFSLKGGIKVTKEGEDFWSLRELKRICRENKLGVVVDYAVCINHETDQYGSFYFERGRVGVFHSKPYLRLL